MAKTELGKQIDVDRLVGEWRGQNQGLDYFVKTRRENGKLIAVKMNGFEYVPQGEQSWWVDDQTLLGEILFTDENFENHVYYPLEIFVISYEKICMQIASREGFERLELRRDDV